MCDFIIPGGQTAEDFMKFVTTHMEGKCQEVEKRTRNQNENALWHELRYGRITASKLHEAAHCRTEGGSLVRQCIGVSKVFETKAMHRGRILEEQVVVEVEKILNISLKKCGLFMMPSFPILGASPDAIGADFVVEVKCPSTEKTAKDFLPHGKLNHKCMAQISLQMFAANRKKGLFCVADPMFEDNRKVTIVSVNFDEDYTMELIESAMKFWTSNIYPVLFESATK